MTVAPDPTARIRRGDGGAVITAAAREAFAERGYYGVSIRDIAKQAGLSVSALYYWYTGKQELLAAVIESAINDYFRTCGEVLRSADDDPAERLRALVRATVDYRIRRRVESHIASREWRNLDEQHALRLKHLRDAATAQWDEIVGEGVRQGLFRCGHPVDARRAVQAACNAIAQWYEPDGELRPHELAERYVAIAMRVVDYRPGAAGA